MDAAAENAEKTPTRRGFSPRRVAIPTVIIALAVAVVLVLLYGVASHSDKTSIDTEVAQGHFPRAPSYTTKLPVLDSNRTMSLSQLHGRWVMLNMFASWCPPCHAEAPLMAKEEKVLSAHHAIMIGIAYKDLSSSTAGFDRHYGLHETVLRDVSGNFAQSYGTYQVPETFLINPQGRIVALKREEVSAQWLRASVLPHISRHA